MLTNEPSDPFLYENRELSWLTFNRRVLREAAGRDNPPLERLKFLAIASSNLDEFFMVRFAKLRARMLLGDESRDPAGLTPREQVRLIAADAGRFMEEQMDLFDLHGVPALEEVGMPLLSYETLTTEQKRWAESRFAREIKPKLTLFFEEKKHALPAVPGRALQMGMMLLGEKKESVHALIMPRASIPRTFKLPKALGDGFLLMEDIISAHAGQLAPGRRVLGCWAYRLTRDADFTVQDGGTANLVAETKKSLTRRKTGDVVRLELDARAPEKLSAWLRHIFRAQKETVYRISGPLNLTFLLKELYGAKGLDTFRYPPFQGRMPARFMQKESIFRTLRAGDVFLHHPYDSFDAVLRFVREAASDPRVLAIYQTLYRVSGRSPVIRALCDAAEAGKRVVVLLEVKARFDEENNIRWGEVLRRAGCDVIYGLPELKTHSKITLITRREADGLRRYMHLGTGNYNDVTAKQYTDMGLLTCHPAFGEDAQAFFNMIIGFSKEPKMKKLVYAPKMLRGALTELIRAETEHARAGRRSGIYAKMNSLVDTEIIRLLYEAAAAGVPIRLMVRGICCLRAGVEGLSETVEVRSIVGRFLEHSRVFRFENGGDARLFLSSADWMPRNLNRRVELMFPVEDTAVKAQVQRVLDVQWADSAKAWRMEPDGTYRRMAGRAKPLNAQEALFQGVTGNPLLPCVAREGYGSAAPAAGAAALY